MRKLHELEKDIINRRNIEEDVMKEQQRENFRRANSGRKVSSIKKKAASLKKPASLKHKSTSVKRKSTSLKPVTSLKPATSFKYKSSSLKPVSLKPVSLKPATSFKVTARVPTPYVTARKSTLIKETARLASAPALALTAREIALSEQNNSNLDDSSPPHYSDIMDKDAMGFEDVNEMDLADGIGLENEIVMEPTNASIEQAPDISYAADENLSYRS